MDEIIEKFKSFNIGLNIIIENESKNSFNLPVKGLVSQPFEQTVTASSNMMLDGNAIYKTITSNDATVVLFTSWEEGTCMVEHHHNDATEELFVLEGILEVNGKKVDEYIKIDKFVNHQVKALSTCKFIIKYTF